MLPPSEAPLNSLSSVRRNSPSSQKTTWTRAILTFISPIILVLGFRWFLFEPYVIPSGSMIPTLLVHDHILVNKWVHGLRIPFTERWIFFWRRPQVGEVVVFRYPRNRDTFYVKRIVAIEGDTIEVKEGQLIRNGQPVERIPVDPKTGDQISALIENGSDFNYYQEKLGEHSFISRSSISREHLVGEKVQVPQDHFFVVGDNRDESSDSRSWSFVPMSNLMGQAGLIWLSCENTLPATPFICDPKTIRWKRLFSFIE